MKLMKLMVEFATVFMVAGVTATIVTLLWNIIWHAEVSIDWETSFLFAILFGVFQTWVRSRENKGKG